jgi:hypothetical protein
MTQNEYIENLRLVIDELDKSLYWLKRSFDKCQSLDINDNLTDDNYDDLETLTSRFARTSDMIIQKVFRAIDKVELTEGGSLIDVINRACKREIINSTDEIREIRDLRNEIAHSYVTEELKPFLTDIKNQVPILFKITENTKKYTEKYL